MKGFGYLVSVLSVLLLAVPAWDNASRKPLLFLCLLVGMVASMLGMMLRWAAYRREQREKGNG